MPAHWGEALGTWDILTVPDGTVASLWPSAGAVPGPLLRYGICCWVQGEADRSLAWPVCPTPSRACRRGARRVEYPLPQV